MAAQVIGPGDQVTKEELKTKAFRGVHQGTIVGQEGLEYYYDRYLRGKPGIRRVEVNAEGLPVSARLPPEQPVAGHSLRLPPSLGLQKAAQQPRPDAQAHPRPPASST